MQLGAYRMLLPFLLLAQATNPAALFPEILFPPVLFSAALFILFLIILLVILLAIPVHLNLDLKKHGPLIKGSYRLSWLGLTFRKREVLQQPALDSLESISKKDGAVDESGRKEFRTEENGDSEKGKSEKGRSKKGKSDGGKKTGDSSDEEKSDTKRSPGPKTLLNVAPAIAHLSVDLFKSIVFQKLSCRLCLGLNDPAETAVISGYLWSVASTLGHFRANVFIEPFFEGERLEGEFVAELKIRLLWIARAVINALREKEIRSLIREVAGWG